MSYSTELTKAMTVLGEKSDTIFLGQQVLYPGNSIYKTLADVPPSKRIELPVFEDCQLGMSIGLALTGKTVISIFPRMDFLLCATNQLVNHLDKLEDFTNGQYWARVIIRVGIGSKKPMYPGVQHCGDYIEGLRAMLRRTPVIRLNMAKQVGWVYEAAYKRDGSTIIVEEMDKYGME